MLIAAVFCILLANSMLEKKIDFLKLMIVYFAAISPRCIERRAALICLEHRIEGCRGSSGLSSTNDSLTLQSYTLSKFEASSLPQQNLFPFGGPPPYQLAGLATGLSCGHGRLKITCLTCLISKDRDCSKGPVTRAFLIIPRYVCFYMPSKY